MGEGRKGGDMGVLTLEKSCEEHGSRHVPGFLRGENVELWVHVLRLGNDYLKMPQVLALTITLE